MGFSNYGPATQYRAFTPADRDRLSGSVPGYLLDLWEADGWASYRDGLVWTVDPHEYAPIVAAWNLPDPSLRAVARTAFGVLYMLRDFTTQRGTPGHSIRKLDPHTGAYANVGPVAEKFLGRMLDDEEYVTLVFAGPEARQAAADLGPLAWNEMYGYEPALAFGGSGAPETVRRYPLFAHHALLSQLVEPSLQRF